jgi:hypothetical protein
MLVGLPFDLIITRENINTGEKEEKYLPLITFASELTLDALEELKPFSFHKKESVIIAHSKVSVFREYHFGGKVIRAFSSPPRWEDPGEMKLVIREVLNWFEKNSGNFDIPGKMERVKQDFDRIKSVVKGKLKSFDFYWRGFLFRELKHHLKMDDLDLFFKFHSGFSFINLKKLLPNSIIRELIKARWPQFLEINEEEVKVLYIKNKPFVKCEYPFFEKVDEQELILPTGERAGVILGGREFLEWEHAVYEFNRWKKKDLFERKLKDLKKPGYMDDLIDIPFPQPLEGGRGKDNTPIEFYVVPKVEGEEVFLIHYFEKENAQTYFDAFRSQWEEYVRAYKKKKIENIFKQKGWKVK